MKKRLSILLAAGMLTLLPRCAKAGLPEDREIETPAVTAETPMPSADENRITDPSFENDQTSYRIVRMASALQSIKPEIEDDRYSSRIDDSLAHTGSGALLWSTMYYGPKGKPFDPWTELETKYSEPFATIFYPPYQGKGGVMPSLRAWQIRDGIEDFDYLKLLEAKKGRAYVLEAVAPFISDPLEIKSDYRTLLKIREKIAEELEQ